MGISKMANGFYTFSDNYFKTMRKQDLINYIRTIEKNWQNSLITNDIQYENCKRLLAEERSKAIDEFVKEICKKYTEEENKGNCRQYCVNIKQNIADMAEQMKGKYKV